MRTKKLTRCGNALVPAIFLLMFIAIFGAVLLRGAFLSITVSARIVSVRQAEALAKSGTDYICDTLFGNQGTDIFKKLDEKLEKLAINSPFNIPLEINGEKLDSSITLLTRTNAGNTITDIYTVKTKAIYRGQKGACTRRMTSIREKSGLGDDKIIGTFLSSLADNYDISGPYYATPSKTIGPIRVENGQEFISKYYIVEGNVYVNAAQNISLLNTTIKGDLYLQNEFSSPNGKAIQLQDIDVEGDIIIFSKVDVALIGNIECENMYISAPSLSATIFTTTAKKIYIGSSTSISGFDAIDPNLITRNDAAVNAKRQDSKNVEIKLEEPFSFDFELTNETDANNFFNNTHDLSGGITIDVDADKIFSDDSTGKSITVTGDGTLNIWMEKSSDANLSHVEINRISGNASINFICLDNSASAFVVNKVFNANIIFPKGRVTLNSARLGGVLIGQSFTFQAAYGNAGAWGGIHINTTEEWANTGSLPGLGEGSVKYIYNEYLK